jgi:cellulose synthase/poly-beta-1,6-N-acetylglucosamine synthase-like glycosyltransferase
MRVLGAEGGHVPMAVPYGRRAPVPRPKDAPAVAADVAAPLPVELAALAGLVDPALLEAAARRAERLGVGGDEVLRAHNIISADALVAALAAHLGLAIDPLDDGPPPETARLLEALQRGMLRRRPDHPLTLTIAPQGLAVRRLASEIEQRPALRSQLRIAAPEHLTAYVRREGATELARDAALGLVERHPELSAASRRRVGRRRLFALTIAALAIAAVSNAEALLLALEAMFAFVFLAGITLRLNSCMSGPLAAERAELPIRHLPTYTIVVPLYGEAHMVRRLVDALGRLDYPREKLDIKLVVEADDVATRAAVAPYAGRWPFEEIVAPLAGPRTKPKALAAALPFARGAYLVVYDAEDVPEPDQLKVAIAAFAKDPALACVQAGLAIDNAGDNWLTRHFAAEYAGLFEVFLPALADLRLPLPLGGTSNHFRVDVLRAVGGWDPFNVTEDADLGIRLARFGHRTGVIASTTWEEAPARFQSWLRQRTRWFKGWLQTWAVHMRQPARLYRELGAGGFAAFQLTLGGTVLAALVHPFFLALLVADFLNGTLAMASADLFATLHKSIALTTLLSGYVCSALLGLIGLARRGMLRNGWVLLTIPLYWLLLSLAAWRAVVQLMTAPHRWEKTEHGGARTSLRARLKQREPVMTAMPRSPRRGAGLSA